MQTSTSLRDILLPDGLQPQMVSIHDFNKNNGTNKGSGSTSNNNGGGSTPSTPIGVNAVTGADVTDPFDAVSDMLINYNELAKEGAFSEAYFRDMQIAQVVSILRTKTRPNALITGQAGVGKTQIIEEVARRLVNDDPIVANALKGVTIYELPLGKIVSGASYVGQLEQKLYDVIDFAKDPANNAILFIDEIHQILGGSSNPQYDKIAQILKPALGRAGIRVIGATTSQEAVTFLSDPAFNRRWFEVQVPELSHDETVEIVELVRDSFQNHHNVIIPDSLIPDIVTISDEYKAYGSHRPDSAITLLDKAMSDARMKRFKLIEDAKANPNLNHIITAQPKPLLTAKQIKQSAMTLLTGDENMFEKNADNLEATLDANVIGQADAKTAVVDAVRRLGLRLTKRKRPVSFLFAGASGTGKTEVAKQIANAVFGGRDRMVYINMSEFSNPTSLTRIIGSSAGYIGSESKRELPFDVLENNPYQLVLLDEFEKAHTDVQRFFMQALDEGVVKTNRNKVIDFTRAIVVATTNAGAFEMSKKSLGFATEEPVLQTPDVIQALRGAFDVELINRFEKVIPFTAISKADYTRILAVKYNAIVAEAAENRRDLQLDPQDIDVTQAETFEKLVELAEASYTPASNGRPAERTVREYIERRLLDDPNATQFTFL